MSESNDRLFFPKWTNLLRPILAFTLLGAPVYLGLVIFFGASPETIAVGYQPVQPVAYSHALHVGELGLDCRYCHTGVEIGAKALIPPTQTCMGCHSAIHTESQALALVRSSYETGSAVPWIRVHDIPDYAYFNHSAHVTRGVPCEACHGRVDTMEVVRQVEPLSMGWCLDCHRDPSASVRPADLVTVMGFDPPEGLAAVGAAWVAERGLDPSTDCWTCHR